LPVDREKLLRKVERMPAFPESVHKILQLTADVDCSPKDLVKVIEHDPVMTLKVLKLVNSAFFGLSNEVTSVNHAVVYLGINTVKNVAISIATAGALPRTNKAGLDMETFWAHSLMVGVVAKLLAAERGVPATAVANYFVAGLLHDIGKIVFAHFIPDDYREVLDLVGDDESRLPLVEIRRLGLSHCEIGAILAEKWQLHKELVASIRHHHDLKIHDLKIYGDDEITGDVMLAVYAANQICHLKQGQTVIKKVPQSVQDWLGEPMEESLASLSHLDEEVEKALAFIAI